MPFIINTILSWEQLNSLRDEWNPLLRSSNADTIFLTWEWIQAWHAVVGEDTKLYVITVRNDEGILLGIAPFYRYRLRVLNLIRFKTLRILADDVTGSEYGDWIIDKDAQNEVSQAITEELKRSRLDWDLIWMPRLSTWNGALQRLTQSAKMAGLFVQSRERVFSAIQLPKQITDLEKQFSPKRRSRLRSQVNKFVSNPDIAIRQCQNHKDLGEYIEALFSLHHQRRMKHGDPGCFQRIPGKSNFYRHFLPIALDKGWLRLTALKHKGEFEAIQVGYVYNKDFLSLQEGFNPDFNSGVGNVLRYTVIEKCIEEGLDKYDFLGGFTEHKRRWHAKTRLGADLLIGHSSLKNRLLFFLKLWPSGRFIQEEELFESH